MSHLTPYNDNYPTCELTNASLLIYCESVDPKEITLRLGVAPTKSWRRGEHRGTGRRGVPMVAGTTGWILSSEGSVVSRDLRRHIDWLVDKLSGSVAALRSLQGLEGAQMRVNCVWWSASGQGGPTISPEEMCRLAEMNLEVSFDIYFFGTDE